MTQLATFYFAQVPMGALGIYREILIVLNFNLAADQCCPVLERDLLTHILYCIAEAKSAHEECGKALRMYKLALKLRNSFAAKKKDRRTARLLRFFVCYVSLVSVMLLRSKMSSIKRKSSLKNRLLVCFRDAHH
jgi:hypothetical protein